MPTANRVEFFDHFPTEIMLSLPKEAHVFYAGLTEHLPQEMLYELRKQYQIKEFVIIYNFPFDEIDMYQ